MFLLPSMVLLVSGVLGEEFLVHALGTYNHSDPVSGKNLVCAMCPPGQHLLSHCSATAPTRCGPCAERHYTEIDNYLPQCLYCDNYCTQNQEVQQECSPTRNRVCRCKKGYYMIMDFCFQHAKCGPGQGVRTPGSPQRNTECEACPEGFFSSSTSATQPCIRHSGCSGNHTVLFAGSSHSDTLCGSCQDLAEGGEALRRFLLRFFSSRTIRDRAMRRFVSRNRQALRVQRGRAPGIGAPRRGAMPPETTVSKWLESAPSGQLWELPRMLRAAQLNSMAERLHNKLRRVEKRSPNCSLTSRMIGLNHRA